MTKLKTETVTLNMGPHHPSTHGVFRLILTLDGENTHAVADFKLRNAFFNHERATRSNSTFKTVRVYKFLGQSAQKLFVGTLEHRSEGRIDKANMRFFVHQKNPIGCLL